MIANWGDQRLPERFWEKVIPEPNTGCWMWLDMNGRKPQAYRFDQRRKSRAARPHRLAYETFIGQIPDRGLIRQSCRNETCVNPAHLVCKTKSQDSSTAIDITGRRFGMLVAVERIPGAWRCVCDCGRMREASCSYLKKGVVTHCGCKRHGKYGTRTYRSWQSMLTRCRNPNTPYFANYGGRGIVVCDRWLDFKAFFADMGERPDDTTLDRIDPNGNYEPANCQWATWATQAKNKRTALHRIAHELDVAISRVSADNYSQADVIDLLRTLKDDLCGGER